MSLFSVVNQFAIINIISELSNPTNKRIVKVITRSSIFPLIVYITIGVVGYGTYGSQTPGLVVQRDKVPGTSDILMTIGRLLLTIALITGIIIRSNSNQSNLVNIIFRIQQLCKKKKTKTADIVKTEPNVN